LILYFKNDKTIIKLSILLFHYSLKSFFNLASKLKLQKVVLTVNNTKGKTLEL